MAGDVPKETRHTFKFQVLHFTDPMNDRPFNTPDGLWADRLTGDRTLKRLTANIRHPEPSTD